MLIQMCGSVAAITLCKNDEQEAAREQFSKFESTFMSVGKETQSADVDVTRQRQLLTDALHSAT